jgi:hypothetical protein
MDVVCSLSFFVLTIQSNSVREAHVGSCCQPECLLSNYFPDQMIQGAPRSREIDVNDAKMADPVDGDDVSFIIS